MSLCRSRIFFVSSLALSGVFSFTAAARAAGERFDLVLTNATIHIGDGTEPFTGHIAVRRDRVAAIETGQAPDADIRIDCSGLVAVPGFIDLHNHSDDPILERDTRSNVNYLLQGCTTIVTGNCGMGHVDVATYLESIDRNGAGTNVAHLLPQGGLRSAVMGRDNRKPTEDELNQMRTLAEQAMTDGAFGMSTGLIYIPGTLTSTDELIELAKVIARHDGLYVSHIRNEGSELLQSIEEAIQIGRAAGCAVHISHFKASGRPNWGTLRVAIDRVHEIRLQGFRITADQYPYAASSTSLEATLLPNWSREGGRERLMERLQDPDTAARIRDAVVQKLQTSSRIQLASCRLNPAWVGRSIEEIAADQKLEIADLVLEIERNEGAAVINFGMSEDDVISAMPMDWVATASDGGAKRPDATQPHPRSFGTFPRKIGRYAIEQGIISLTSAVRSATGLPAEILDLQNRGLLKPGFAADIAVFDPSTFRDRATFEQPWLPPTGIRYVLVNGTLAVYDGQATGTLTGRALRKSGRQ